MSLIGSSIYRGRRSPLRNNVKIKLEINFNGASLPTVSGYTGVIPQYIDPNGVYVLDFPTTFNNLANQNTNPFNTNTPTTLISEIATWAGPGFLTANWFPLLTGSPPPLDPQHSRVWFAFEDETGAGAQPGGGTLLVELTLTDSKLVPQQLT